MSLTDYRESLHLAEGSFYGLIMAAMRNADTVNLEKLKAAFPEQWAELQARYNAPGGCLNQGEMDWLQAVLEADQEDECECHL